MKLTQLAKKPQLIKITLDDEETIKEYKEGLEFWIWDRQPIDKFIKLATMKNENIGELVTTINEMILDEQGKPVITDGLTLPTGVMTRVIGRVVETLGK